MGRATEKSTNNNNNNNKTKQSLATCSSIQTLHATSGSVSREETDDTGIMLSATSRSSFSEACREQTSFDQFLSNDTFTTTVTTRNNRDGGSGGHRLVCCSRLERDDDDDDDEYDTRDTNQPLELEATGTLSLDAAVSLASMRQDHKNDPPLPTDVIQRIFEPMAAVASDAAAVVAAATIEETAATSPTTSYTATTTINGIPHKQPSLVQSSVTSDLEFSTALNLLAICKPEETLSTSKEVGLPVPISPSHSQQSDTTATTAVAATTTMHPSSIQSQVLKSSQTKKKKKKTAVKRKLPTDSNDKKKNPSTNIRPRRPLSPTTKRKKTLMDAAPSVIPRTQHVFNNANTTAATATTTSNTNSVSKQQQQKEQQQQQQPIIVRTGRDPHDGAPTVVRVDGGVLREMKEHVLPHPKLDKDGKPKTLHDELLKEGLVLPTQEDLEACPTVRQQKAFWTFMHRVNELRQYIQHYGDANVPQQLPEAHSLGIWVNKMRMEKKKMDAGERTSLTERKVELLEFFGFVWAQSCKGELGWENRFCELKAFKDNYGHCNVPTKCKKNRALGRWVSTQRAMYKSYKEGRGSKTIHKEEIERRIERLEELGFCFSMLLPGESGSETDSQQEHFNTTTDSQWTDSIHSSTTVDTPGKSTVDHKRETIKSSDTQRTNDNHGERDSTSIQLLKQ
ncbi:helicase domain protein [Nitzschia inconspicua]|uniref:Helicase domain protein n=1 Tax=Nitzschia inconspicua TaxID=303405 RepID=A0A9K3Q1M4_9STRA|nr:helicase domain protein [Nitzschia inconspicua]